jgi:Uma2 family endonuclease
MITVTQSSRQQQIQQILSLEDWERYSPNGTEWINNKLVEKNGMGLRHSRVELRLGRYWANYAESSGQGGEVYTDVPCRTQQQGRRPDVAYLPPPLLDQFGDVEVLPQSFPLIAEIISPTDFTEDVFEKVNEYLQSGCQEIWLVLPESQWVIVITSEQRLLFRTGETVSTQAVLPGFKIEVDLLIK